MHMVSSQIPHDGASFGVKTGQMPHLFPTPREGVVGHNIDRCILILNSIPHPNPSKHHNMCMDKIMFTLYFISQHIITVQ